MTGPDDHPSLEDIEAVSAHLDGEATAEDAARIEADPALQALAARLGAVRDRLAVDEPADALVESQVAAALDAFDTGPSTAPVVSLSSVRERRWYHRIPLGAVAAALVVVALIGAITQIDLGSDDSADTAASAGDDGGSANDEAALEDAGSAAGGGADAGAASTEDSASAHAPMAGTAALEFASADELAAHIMDDVVGSRNESQYGDTGAGVESAPEDDPDQATGCDPVAAAGIEGAPLLAVVPAVVDGRPVTAVVVEGDDAPRLVVVDDATCAVADDRILDG